MFDRGTRGSQQKKKISPTVQVPGHGLMYKSTLTSLLNENPTLSHDRLVRVRQRATQGAQQVPPATSTSLYDDYAVYEKDTSQFIVANCKECGRRETEGTSSTDNLSDLMTLSWKTLKPSSKFTRPCKTNSLNIRSTKLQPSTSVKPPMFCVVWTLPIVQTTICLQLLPRPSS